MTQPATAQPNTEITGVRSLVAYLEQVAASHAGYAGDEGFTGSLRRMDVGVGDQQLVADAQETSRNAAGMWADAAQSVRANNLPLAEQYSLNPQAANKHANTNE